MFDGKVSKLVRSRIVDEFYQVCGCDRKYAIRLPNGPAPQKPKATPRKGRRPSYGAKVILSLEMAKHRISLGPQPPQSAVQPLTRIAKQTVGKTLGTRL